MSDKNKYYHEDNMPLFRFCFLLVLVFGVLFLVNGFIQSNFGYPPIHDIAESGYRSAPVPGTKDVLAAVMGNKKLHSPWPVPADVRQPGPFTRLLEEIIFDKTNRRRIRRALHSLKNETGLRLTARFHSGDMAKKGFFDHRNPDNVGPSFRAAKIHRRFVGLIGENIFKMTKDTQEPEKAAEQIVEGWMNSPGHRENILRDKFDVLGVGCYEGLENNRPRVYATQVFGTLIARLSNDFPVEVKPGQTLHVSIESVNPGYQ
ncbi:MAG: CAP domain-containing protein, partial [bacterium]|nr:CAP domain-containing protein [bacterium]